ncbi:hypothetical protein RJT34_08305 [Clitoria ternatea]|uniref:Uncharacterized protein n=1 Tax=Clitoria ternatea TaxID=43366 RepID=A0AAN9PUH9_CLITE
MGHCSCLWTIITKKSLDIVRIIQRDIHSLVESKDPKKPIVFPHVITQLIKVGRVSVPCPKFDTSLLPYLLKPSLTRYYLEKNCILPPLDHPATSAHEDAFSQPAPEDLIAPKTIISLQDSFYLMSFQEGHTDMVPLPTDFLLHCAWPKGKSFSFEEDGTSGSCQQHDDILVNDSVEAEDDIEGKHMDDDP